MRKTTSITGYDMRRLIVGCVIAIFVVSGSFALLHSFALTADDQPLTTVEGKVTHIVADDFAHNRDSDEYYVEQPGRSLQRIDTKSLKRQLKHGSKVRIRGHIRANQLVADAPADPVQVLAAPAAADVPIDSDTGTGAAGSYNRVIVLVQPSVSDGSSTYDIRPVMSVADAKKLYTAPTNPDAYWRQVSNGTTQFTTTILPITIKIDVTGYKDCSGATVRAWADKVDAAAKAAGYPLTQYNYTGYFLAMNNNTTCNFGGLGDAPGTRSWMMYGYAGSTVSTNYAMGSSAHELGHNLGLQHITTQTCTDNGVLVMIGSSCTYQTYTDPFDVMGFHGNGAPPLLSGYHKVRLGYIPASKVRTITSSGLYHLSSADLAPQNATYDQSIRLAHDAKNFTELEYRSPSGTVFDNFPATAPVFTGLTTQLVPNAASEATASAILLDNTIQTPTVFTDAPLTGGSFIDPVAPGRSTAVKIISRTATDIYISIGLNGQPAPSAPTSPTPSPTPTPTPSPTPSPTPTPTPSPSPGTSTIGDANGDKRINAIDLSIVISHDGQTYPAADFNRDNTIGAADLAILLAHWTW